MTECKTMKASFISTVLVLTLSSLSFADTKPVNNDETYKKLETFSKVLGYIEDNYIESTSPTKLIDDALRGMTSSLDPHTVYLPPELYKQMKVDTSGEFGGVGVELGFNSAKELIVVTPTEDGPAMRMGVLPGDRLLEVDGKPTQGWTLFEAVKHMRGARGSTIRMTLQHKDDPVPYDIQLKREIMHIQSVESRMMPNDIGYIQIKSFQEKTDQETKKAFIKLQSSAKDQKLKGLILDLRNDPGGLLDQAVSVADLFLKEGVIVSTRIRDNVLQSQAKAQTEGTLPDVPMVTLINEGTASAAEIVAAALQDLKRSPLLGTPTFGKGSVQNIIDLGDGSAVKITIARYYTPNGRAIQNLGNQPDIFASPYAPASPTEITAIREKDLQGRIDTLDEKGLKPGSKAKTKGEDPIASDLQLKAAVEYLRVSGLYASQPQNNDK